MSFHTLLRIRDRYEYELGAPNTRRYEQYHAPQVYASTPGLRRESSEPAKGPQSR